MKKGVKQCRLNVLRRNADGERRGLNFRKQADIASVDKVSFPHGLDVGGPFADGFGVFADNQCLFGIGKNGKITDMYSVGTADLTDVCQNLRRVGMVQRHVFAVFRRSFMQFETDVLQFKVVLSLQTGQNAVGEITPRTHIVGKQLNPQGWRREAATVGVAAQALKFFHDGTS